MSFHVYNSTFNVKQQFTINISHRNEKNKCSFIVALTHLFPFQIFLDQFREHLTRFVIVHIIVSWIVSRLVSLLSMIVSTETAQKSAHTLASRTIDQKHYRVIPATLTVQWHKTLPVSHHVFPMSIHPILQEFGRQVRFQRQSVTTRIFLLYFGNQPLLILKVSN